MNEKETAMNGRVTYLSKAERWQAVVRRDAQAADAFVYGVVTTGIYCRPGCPSRLPNRENVRFFDTAEAAEAAGLRPCKRCTPRLDGPDPMTQVVATACRMIETAVEEPSLQELADAVYLSPHHFHRVFKERVGLTPKQYAAEHRLDRLREAVQASGTIADAIYEAGFGSSSRFYEVATAALGMTASEYRDGGPGLTIRYAIAQSYLGWVLVAGTAKGICRIDLGDDPEQLAARLAATFPEARLVGDDLSFRDTVRLVLVFLDRPERGLDLPLDIQGTAFQRRVWSALQDIPVGETLSYSEVAERIGQPSAARAVAGACAANTLAVAIPCHRVVRTDGTLGGYRWGLDRKRALLDREGKL